MSHTNAGVASDARRPQCFGVGRQAGRQRQAHRHEAHKWYKTHARARIFRARARAQSGLTTFACVRIFLAFLCAFHGGVHAHRKLVDGGCLKCDTLCVSLCVSVDRAHASFSLICGDTRQQQQHKRRKKNPRNTLYTLSNVMQTEIFANTHACAAAVSPMRQLCGASRRCRRQQHHRRRRRRETPSAV